MARLLGGTSTFQAGETEYSLLSSTSGVQGVLSTTPLEDVPDPSGALARRFNFFDYAADGQLNGFLTVDQIKLLAHTLLPSPSDFTIIDRTRSSANAYLLDPEALRNYNEITKLNYNWVYASRTEWQSALKKFRGFSPAQYGVNAGLNDRIDPTYVLFEGPIKRQVKAKAEKMAAPADGGTTATTTPGTGASAGAGTTSGTSGSTGTGSASNASGTADNSSALLEALRTLAQNNPTNGSSAGAIQGASNMNRQVPIVNPNVVANLTTPEPKKSKSVFRQIADKTGLGNIF
jgi:hypothetical protein